ncbi:hypothetical protein SCHPADRAFT_947114 [Schizopora paradoxa]|uniref:Uncharacterized protein n=1 Tax=Schizopora paradoxa TaxID=27342 RepID=A0A0H2RK79_9AGAM|nr:hypothetical protein SCHPADRAFT_947114 [Schizopora paradoxa]
MAWKVTAILLQTVDGDPRRATGNAPTSSQQRHLTNNVRGDVNDSSWTHDSPTLRRPDGAGLGLHHEMGTPRYVRRFELLTTTLTNSPDRWHHHRASHAQDGWGRPVTPRTRRPSTTHTKAPPTRKGSTTTSKEVPTLTLDPEMSRPGDETWLQVGEMLVSKRGKKDAAILLRQVMFLESHRRALVIRRDTSANPPYADNATSLRTGGATTMKHPETFRRKFCAVGLATSCRPLHLHCGFHGVPSPCICITNRRASVICRITRSVF